MTLAAGSTRATARGAASRVEWQASNDPDRERCQAWRPPSIAIPCAPQGERYVNEDRRLRHATPFSTCS